MREAETWLRLWTECSAEVAGGLHHGGRGARSQPCNSRCTSVYAVSCDLCRGSVSANLSALKIAPALLTGNTLILKPSPFTPLSMLKVAELTRDFLPAGVFSVISGGDALDPRMTSHPGFAKVGFTGSTATGRAVMKSAAPTLKHLTLELGGNDPAIVMPDVDVESVAKILFWCSLTNSGQICMATKRIYVHEDIYDIFVRTIVEMTKAVKVHCPTSLVLLALR